MIAAPSKLQRPAGDRVKTDAKDAEHLSTLLRLDAFTAVTIPDEHTEAARDLGGHEIRTRRLHLLPELSGRRLRRLSQ